MEDISTVLLEEVQKRFEEYMQKDAFINEFVSSIARGTADFFDCQLYSKKLGDLLGDALCDVLKHDILPNEQMYVNIAKSVLIPTLEKNFDLINLAASTIQKGIDDKMGLFINPVDAFFNQNRIEGVCFNVSTPNITEEELHKRIREDITNTSESFFDSFIEMNANVRYKLGQMVTITRVSNGKACKWCKERIGSFNPSDQVVKSRDIWQRHKNCHCVITYRPSLKMRRI